MRISDIEAKLESICPEDGLASTDISGMPRSLSFRAATTVFAICVNERTPSCNRVPPLVANVITGNRWRAASSNILATFSPTTRPMLPPRNPKSMAMMAQGAPPIRPMPVTAASESPVRT